AAAAGDAVADGGAGTVDVVDVPREGEVTVRQLREQVGTELRHAHLADQVLGPVERVVVDVGHHQLVLQHAPCTQVEVGAHVDVDAVGLQRAAVGEAALRVDDRTTGRVTRDAEAQAGLRRL